MSMKKILMAAVAVSALTAGAASAASISSALVSNQTAWNGTTSTAYKIASETIFGTTGLNTTATAAHNSAVGTVTAGQLGVGTYIVTFALSGPAGFQSALTNSSLTPNSVTTTTGTCIVAPTLVSGGTTAGTSVTYSVNLSGTCSTSASAAADNKGPSAFTLAQPLTITGLGSVTETVSFSQGGVAIDNGTSAAVTLVSNTSGFTTTAAADAVATQWALGTGAVPYIALTGTASGYDAVIGTYTVAAVAGIFADAAATLVSTENLTYNLSVAADLSNLQITETVGSTVLARNVAKTAATATALAGSTNSRTLAVSTIAVNTASQSAKTFTLTVTPVTTSVKLTAPAAYTTALQSIGLEGTNFLAPWVGGSQSTTNSIIRLSNSGVATGAVTLQLAAAVRNTGTTVGATTCTSATLPSLASIAAGAELSILAPDLTTCFGDFKRGDVTITVQAASTALTAKARNNNAATGLVSELSLGATSGRN